MTEYLSMKNTVLTTILITFACFSISLSQYCTQWDVNTRYYKGDQVKYNGNAYEAKVEIWQWNPTYPQYWKQIPVASCDM